MKKISRDHFILAKVKQLNAGGIIAEFKVKGSAGGDQFVTDHTLKDPREPHPDLTGLIDKLDLYLAKSIGLADFLAVIDGIDVKMTKAQEMVIRRTFDHLLSLIEVTGIAISGDQEKRGAIIMGTMLCKNGATIALNSPLIKTELTKFGFEEELGELIDDLHRETYLYFYEGKAAQLQLFDESKEEGKIRDLVKEAV